MTAEAGLTPEQVTRYGECIVAATAQTAGELLAMSIASEATASLRAALTTTTQQRDKLTRTIEVASRTFEEILRREALKRVTAEEESRALQAALRAKATE